jgi:hypothetical protein
MSGEDKVTEYLELGGLFNPEMMEHDKVRDLLISLRDELSSLRSQLENANAEIERLNNVIEKRLRQ